MDGASLIKVLMLVGFFHGDQLVHSDRQITTRAHCEAAKSYAAEFNSRFTWFWEEDTKESVSIVCLAHPGEREA